MLNKKKFIILFFQKINSIKQITNGTLKMSVRILLNVAFTDKVKFVTLINVTFYIYKKTSYKFTIVIFLIESTICILWVWN